MAPHRLKITRYQDSETTLVTVVTFCLGGSQIHSLTTRFSIYYGNFGHIAVNEIKCML
jgi:hypothetical protein